MRCDVVVRTLGPHLRDWDRNSDDAWCALELTDWHGQHRAWAEVLVRILYALDTACSETLKYAFIVFPAFFVELCSLDFLGSPSLHPPPPFLLTHWA